MTSIDESLLYLRHWPQSDKYGDLHLLFSDGNPTRATTVGSPCIPLQWQYPCEFVSTVYSEPLECVHARRRAFGGSSITFDSPLPTQFPDRCLLSNDEIASEYRVGSIRVKWLLESVFEVPAFCIATALAEKSRVDWGFERDQIEMLKAAMTIKPTCFDVVGVYTMDTALVGALEFAGRIADDVYFAHLVAAVRNGRQLSKGDKLYGRYTGNVGKTPIIAERCIFEVLDIGDQSIPALPVYRDDEDAK